MQIPLPDRPPAFVQPAADACAGCLTYYYNYSFATLCHCVAHCALDCCVCVYLDLKHPYPTKSGVSLSLFPFAELSNGPALWYVFRISLFWTDFDCSTSSGLIRRWWDLHCRFPYCFIVLRPLYLCYFAFSKIIIVLGSHFVFSYMGILRKINVGIANVPLEVIFNAEKLLKLYFCSFLRFSSLLQIFKLFVA